MNSPYNTAVDDRWVGEWKRRGGNVHLLNYAYEDGILFIKGRRRRGDDLCILRIRA